MRFGVLVITAVALMFLSNVPVTARGQQSETDLLPPGPGRDVTVAKCGLCHSVRNIAATGRQTADFWRETVEEMYYEAGWEADDDQKIIIDYLATALGPEEKPEEKASAPVRPMPAHTRSEP